MDIHPIQESPRRWVTALTLAVLAAGVQMLLLWQYAGADWLPAGIDGFFSVGLLCLLAYFSWYIIGFVSMIQTDLVASCIALLLWLPGCLAVQYTVELSTGLEYAPFCVTLPFRLIFGILAWVIMMQWYRLQSLHTLQEEIVEEATSKTETLQEEIKQVVAASGEQAPTETTEYIDRITIKDGSRIHLIKIEELIYIQACGDYVNLVTADGQYVKEQTMKYLETHLPVNGFVRIHRSTIVNVTQISRVELFGKENYQLLLKNGAKLKVSQSGYKLLKSRLEL